jgi:hypothetical protein
MPSERSKTFVGRTALGGRAKLPEVKQGKRAGMLPCIAFGDDLRSSCSRGLGLSNTNPTEYHPRRVVGGERTLLHGGGCGV